MNCAWIEKLYLCYKLKFKWSLQIRLITLKIENDLKIKFKKIIVGKEKDVFNNIKMVILNSTSASQNNIDKKKLLFLKIAWKTNI